MTSERTFKAGNSGRFRLVVGIALLGLAALVVVVGAVIIKKRKPLTASELHNRGALEFRKRNYPQAYTFFAEALKLDRTNSLHLRAAAESAAAMGRRPQALSFMRDAWRAGMRSEDLLRQMVDYYDPNDRAKALPELLQYVDQLPPGAAREELRGDILFFHGQLEAAARTWSSLMGAQPRPEVTVKLAQVQMALGRTAEAMALLRQELGRGQLNEAGYSILAMQLLTEDAAYTNALAVFESARERGIYGDRLRLEHGAALLVARRNSEAQQVLEPMSHLPPGTTNTPYRVQARIYLGYLFLANRQEVALETLRQTASKLPTDAAKEGELAFQDGCLQLLRGDEGVIERLGRARRLITGQPAIELIYASECFRRARFADSLDACRTVKGIMTLWPPLLLEQASALHGLGRSAEALTVLTRLHARGAYSKQSIELFRDAAVGAGRSGLAEQAQSYLERQFAGDLDVVLYRGFLALRQGSLDQASQVFRQVAARYPEEMRVKIGQLQVMLAQRRYEEVLAGIRSLKEKPGTFAALEGFAHLGLGKTNEAFDAFALAVKRPQPPAVHVEYGRLLLGRKEIELAAEQFKQALERSPESAEARLGLALSLYARGELDAARAAAQPLLARTSSASAEQVVLLASTELRLGSANSAIDFCGAALTKDPKSVEARRLRGTIWLRLGKAAEAEADFAAVVAVRSDDVLSLQQLALAALRRGDAARARDFVERALKVDPANRSSQLLRLELLGSAGQLAEAEALLGSLKPSLSQEQYVLSASWLKQLRGDTNGAVALLEAQLRDPLVAVRWAELQFRLGQDQRVLDRIRDASLSGEQWAGLAAIAESQSKPALAAAMYESALKAAPDNPILLNNWAWNAVQADRFDEEKVLDACKRALAAMPREPKILDTYTVALLRSRRFLECVSVLNANPAVVQQNAQLLWNLGEAQEGAKDTRAALDAFRRSQQLLAAKPDNQVRAGRPVLEQRIARLQAAPQSR